MITFKALPHRQRHRGTDHFCMSGIPVGCMIRGWAPVIRAVSFKFNMRHSTNNNNTWTLTANPVRNEVQHGPADSAIDSRLGVTRYALDKEKLSRSRVSAERDSERLWGSGYATIFYFQWFPNDLGQHHRFTSLPLQYSSYTCPRI